MKLPLTSAGRGKRRGTLLAATLVLTASIVGGCAKYNGDKAAFCAALPKAPTFMDIGVTMMVGDADAAADSLDAISDRFRALERTAPRGIRYRVSSLGDVSERLAATIRDQQMPAFGSPTWVEQGPDQSFDDWSPRQDALMNEVMNHPSVGEAAQALMTYSERNCGIENPENLLGTYGQGYFGSSDGGLNIDGSTFDSNGAPLGPQTTDQSSVFPQPTVTVEPKQPQPNTAPTK